VNQPSDQSSPRVFQNVVAIADGFGHGLVHLWAENGTRLGTASQSTIVRAHGPVDHERPDVRPLTELEGSLKPDP